MCNCPWPVLVEGRRCLSSCRRFALLIACETVRSYVFSAIRWYATTHCCDMCTNSRYGKARRSDCGWTSGHRFTMTSLAALSCCTTCTTRITSSRSWTTTSSMATSGRCAVWGVVFFFLYYEPVWRPKLNEECDPTKSLRGACSCCSSASISMLRACRTGPGIAIRTNPIPDQHRLLNVTCAIVFNCCEHAPPPKPEKG